jgi:hypothetical protein
VSIPRYNSNNIPFQYVYQSQSLVGFQTSTKKKDYRSHKTGNTKQKTTTPAMSRVKSELSESSWPRDFEKRWRAWQERCLSNSRFQVTITPAGQAWRDLQRTDSQGTWQRTQHKQTGWWEAYKDGMLLCGERPQQVSFLLIPRSQVLWLSPHCCNKRIQTALAHASKARGTMSSSSSSTPQTS